MFVPCNGGRLYEFCKGAECMTSTRGRMSYFCKGCWFCKGVEFTYDFYKRYDVLFLQGV